MLTPGRSLPPAIQISASPLEKTDPQILQASGRDVPKRDAHIHRENIPDHRLSCQKLDSLY